MNVDQIYTYRIAVDYFLYTCIELSMRRHMTPHGIHIHRFDWQLYFIA